MATTNRCSFLQEVPHQNCTRCHSAIGIFRCHGCGDAFCEQHAANHRAELKHRLDEIREKNNRLEVNVNLNSYQTMIEDLNRKISEWERMAICKIQQTAQETRRQVSEMMNSGGLSQVKELFECRQSFTNRLEHAARNFDYHELDLKYWNQFLEDLKANLLNLKRCVPRLECSNKPFISKINIVGCELKVDFTKWCTYQKNTFTSEDIKPVAQPDIKCVIINDTQAHSGTFCRQNNLMPDCRQFESKADSFSTMRMPIYPTHDDRRQTNMRFEPCPPEIPRNPCFN